MKKFFASTFAVALVIAMTAVTNAQDETQPSASDAPAPVETVETAPADVVEAPAVTEEVVAEGVPAPMPVVGNVMPLSGCGGCGTTMVSPMVTTPMVTNCGGCVGCPTGCPTTCGTTTPMFAQVAYQQPVTTTQTPIVTSAPLTSVPAQPASVVLGTTPAAGCCGATTTPTYTQPTAIMSQPIAQPYTTQPIAQPTAIAQPATSCAGCGTTATPISYAQQPTTTFAQPITSAPVQSYTAAPATTAGCSNCGQTYTAPAATTCNGCTPQRRGIIRNVFNRR